MNITLEKLNKLYNDLLTNEFIQSFVDSYDVTDCVKLHNINFDDYEYFNTICIGIGNEYNLELQTMTLNTMRWLENVHIQVSITQEINEEYTESENILDFISNINIIIPIILKSINCSTVDLENGIEIIEKANKNEYMITVLNIKLPQCYA